MDNYMMAWHEVLPQSSLWSITNSRGSWNWKLQHRKRWERKPRLESKERINFTILPKKQVLDVTFWFYCQYRHLKSVRLCSEMEICSEVEFTAHSYLTKLIFSVFRIWAKFLTFSCWFQYRLSFSVSFQAHPVE